MPCQESQNAFGGRHEPQPEIPLKFGLQACLVKKA
jgi:hypothetical protein